MFIIYANHYVKSPVGTVTCSTETPAATPDSHRQDRRPFPSVPSIRSALSASSMCPGCIHTELSTWPRTQINARCEQGLKLPRVPCTLVSRQRGPCLTTWEWDHAASFYHQIKQKWNWKSSVFHTHIHTTTHKQNERQKRALEGNRPANYSPHMHMDTMDVSCWFLSSKAATCCWESGHVSA